MLFVLDRGILTTDASAKPINAIDNVAYFQASSLKNQLGGAAPKTATYSGVDGLNGYTVYKNGTVVYKTAGIYFGIYAVQIGSPRGNGIGDIHIWSRRNGRDEANSDSIQSVERGSTSVLVFSTVFQTPSGREAELLFSAIEPDECTSLGLIATVFENEPVVPSIISSEIQLSDLDNPVHYAALTSSKNQLGSPISKPVTLNDPGDISGVGTSNAATDGSIKFSESKLYFAIACGQVGSAPGTDAEGEVHLWWQLNGKSISNSNTIQSVRDGSTAVLVTQTIVRVSPNDKLQIMFSSTNINLGLIVSTPKKEPLVPSMIFSTFELGAEETSLPYAQFSSSISQWGCLTPKAVKIENNDGSNHIKNKNDIIEFKESGVYFLLAAAQVGSLKGKGIGDVHLWMRLNGQDVANSNTIQTIKYNDTSVLVSQGVAAIQAGDKLQVIFSTDVTKGTLGLVATQPLGEPLVPSIIFSAFKANS